MNSPTGNGRRARLTEYESFRRKLIARNLAANPIELPQGFIALFASERGDEPHHAHLFRSNGQEAEAPLTVFTNSDEFTSWIDGLRDAVTRGECTVEVYWREHNQKRNAHEQFAEHVLSCVDDLNAVLARLSARYEDLVIAAALAEQVGGALRIFMENGICTPAQARRVLKHVESTAFPSDEAAEASDVT